MAVALLRVSALSAQTDSFVPLPENITNISRFAIAPWPDRYYYLDDDNLEVVAADGRGRLIARYGGWGASTQALDLPVDLAASENSVWVLDQGINAILRLDPQLNLISVVSLPDRAFSRAFVRDSQQRFWISRENEAGLILVDETGYKLSDAGTELSGESMIRYPALLAADVTGITVWDASTRELIEIDLSGQVRRRITLDVSDPVLAIVRFNGMAILLSIESLIRWDGWRLETIAPNEANWIDLAVHNGGLYLLSANRGVDALPWSP